MSPYDMPEDIARAGTPLEPGAPVASEEEVIEALRGIFDPEIPVNIYDLGLVYEIDIAESGAVAVRMTLTAPACPVAGQMPQEVAEAVAALPGIGAVEVELVWDPPWDPSRMHPDARMALDL